MKYVRHDFVENYINAVNNGDDVELKKIILDELSKIILVQPNLIVEALANSGIDAKSTSPKELIRLVKENISNKKLTVRLSKLILLMNAKSKDGKFLNVSGAMGKTYRSWNSKGADFLKDNSDIENSLDSIMENIIDEDGVKELNESLDGYKNFGGSEKKLPKVQKREISNVQMFGIVVAISITFIALFKLNKE